MIHSTQNGNGPESRHKVSMQRRHDTHDRGNYSYRARTDNSKLCLHTTSHVPITIWCPCVLVSLCTCVFVCLRSLCFTDGVSGRRTAVGGRFFFIHLVWCPCVLVSLCTCVYVCLRSLCFTDGVNGRSDGGRRAVRSYLKGVMSRSTCNSIADRIERRFLNTYIRKSVYSYG